MRTSLIALLAAAAPAFAQTNSSYISGLLQTLSAAGLDRLVSVAQNASNTTTGQTLFAELPNGNKTLFAPNDNAFTGTPPSNITDPNQLANILSYHVALGAFSNFSTAPNDTIMRTALVDPQNVTLEGNKSQVLVASNQNGTLRVVEQNTPVTVLSTTTYQNLIIHVVDAVIDLPPNLPAIFASQNLSNFANAAQQAGDITSLESTRGITIFAPNDAAFSGLNQSTAGGISNNQTLLRTVLGNHIINGTSVYSTQFNEGTHISASGEPFQFTTNSSGTFVSSGSSTARIVNANVIASNGVVHVLDNVLLNVQNNTQAANSAFASATSVAAQKTSETAGVGVSATPTSTSSNGGGQKNGAITLAIPAREWTAVLTLALVGAVLVL